MSATVVATVAKRAMPEIKGVVVSSGLMQKTVKVLVGSQTWNSQVKKYFPKETIYKVHDPNSSLRTGDTVAIVAGWRTAKTKRHVVKHIIAAAGIPVEDRPPVPTEEERNAAHAAQRAAKAERRKRRREAEGMERRVAKAEKDIALLTKEAKKMLDVD